MRIIIAIGLGGACGSVLRYLVAGWAHQLSNTTTLGGLFEFDSSDNGTFPGGQVDLANQAIIIDQYTNLGLICKESGSVTPTDGELGLSFLFQETV